MTNTGRQVEQFHSFKENTIEIPIAGVGTVPQGLGVKRRTSRCSRQGGHNGFPRHFVFPARPAAELCRSASIGLTTKEDFLVCVYSEDSRRHAILFDDGVTGILYLHAPSDDAAKTGEVEATCFAYNRVDPIDTKEVLKLRDSFKSRTFTNRI